MLIRFDPQQWFNMYAPVRLAVDECFPDSSDTGIQPCPVNFPINNIPTNKLDINKIFKGRSDKGKSKTSQNKKTNSNKTQGRLPGGRNLPMR